MTSNPIPSPGRPRVAVLALVALLALVSGTILAGCGSNAGSQASGPPGMPVTFVYRIDGPTATVAHTTHLQVVDTKNVLLVEITLKTVGTVDTGTLSLQPGNYSAISWDEVPASPNPVSSDKCGSPFTIDPGQALVVTVTASRLGPCITDTLEPGASPLAS